MIKNRITVDEKRLLQNNHNAYRRLEEIYERLNNYNSNGHNYILTLIDNRDVVIICEFLEKDGYKTKILNTLQSETEVKISW